MNATEPHPPAGEPPNLEQVWQFAGHSLRSNDFTTAMVHFYRGEVTRSNTWRTRLDNTTNWAVITTGATLTFAFGSTQNPAFVLVINTLLLLLFLFMEARRYRYYELWMSRVRILEQNFFGALLSPPFLPASDWANRLNDSLHHPHFPITLLEAWGRRYRRNYAPMFLILAVSWLLKVYLHPEPTTSWAEFLQRADLGPLSGSIVVGLGLAFHLILIAIGILSVSLHLGSDRIEEDAPFSLGHVGRQIRRGLHEILESDLPSLPRLDLRRRNQMAFIISDQAETVGRALLDDLHRGVTLLHGTGMYTGQEHGVLLCTFQASQFEQLKRTVKRLDPKAFVVVSDVQGVHGLGFRPLEA